MKKSARWTCDRVKRCQALNSELQVETVSKITDRLNYAQASVDALSDLLDVPLFIIRRMTVEALYSKITAKGNFAIGALQSVGEFEEWLSSDEIVDKYNIFRRETINEWRKVFKRLDHAVFLTRPHTGDPLVSRLRAHWLWRWEELHYLSRSVVGMEGYFRFDRSKTHILFQRSFRNVGVLSAALCVGPTRPRRAVSESEQNWFARYLYEFKTELKRFGFSLLYNEMDFAGHLADRIGLDENELAERVDNAFSVIEELHGLSRDCDIDVNKHMIRMLVISLLAKNRFKKPGSSEKPIKRVACEAVNRISISLESGNRGFVRSKSMEQEVEIACIQVKIRDPSRQNEFSSDTEKLVRYLQFLSERLYTKETLRNAEAVALIHSILDWDLRFSYNTFAFAEVENEHPRPNQLSNLARRLARIIGRITSSDACRIYYLDRQKGELFPLGGHSETADKDTDFREPYMRAVPRERLNESLSYAAVLEGTVKMYAPLSSHENISEASTLFDRHSTIIQPSDESFYPPAKSALAVPVLIHGRAWGVIEVASTVLTDYGLKEVGTLIKIAEAIGNDLHSIYVTRLFSNLSNEIFENNNRGQERRQRNLDNLVGRVCDLYLGNTAAIWMRDVFDTREFGLVGSATRGAELKESGIVRASLRLDDATSNTAELFSKKQKCLIGRIGTGRFGNEWASSSERRKMLAKRYKGIALIALYDRSGGPIGSISIYSENPYEGENWVELGRFLSDYASALVEYLLGLKVEAAARLSLDQHEIDNNIFFSKARIKKLSERINSLVLTKGDWSREVSAQKIRADFASFQTDMFQYLGQIKNIASYSSDRRRDVTVSAVYSKLNQEKGPAPWTSLREIVNTCFQAVRQKYKRSKVELRLDYSQLTFEIKAFPEDLRTIFTNLSSNAVKHSKIASSLLVSAVNDKYTLSIHVKNIAPPLTEEDEVQIFDAEFRGSQAITNQSEGQGLGLYIARRICEEYQFELRHDQSKTAGEGLVWHDFTIEIPSVDVKPEF